MKSLISLLCLIPFLAMSRNPSAIKKCENRPEVQILKFYPSEISKENKHKRGHQKRERQLFFPGARDYIRVEIHNKRMALRIDHCHYSDPNEYNKVQCDLISHESNHPQANDYSHMIEDIEDSMQFHGVWSAVSAAFLHRHILKYGIQVGNIALGASASFNGNAHQVAFKQLLALKGLTNSCEEKASLTMNLNYDEMNLLVHDLKERMSNNDNLEVSESYLFENRDALNKKYAFEDTHNVIDNPTKALNHP